MTAAASEALEYKVREFRDQSGFRYVGSPLYGTSAQLAEQWINEMAVDGWKLDKFEPRNRYDIYVVLVRPLKPASKRPASAGRRSGPL